MKHVERFICICAALATIGVALAELPNSWGRKINVTAAAFTEIDFTKLATTTQTLSKITLYNAGTEDILFLVNVTTAQFATVVASNECSRLAAAQPYEFCPSYDVHSDGMQKVKSLVMQASSVSSLVYVSAY